MIKVMQIKNIYENYLHCQDSKFTNFG